MRTGKRFRVVWLDSNSAAFIPFPLPKAPIKAV